MKICALSIVRRKKICYTNVDIMKFREVFLVCKRNLIVIEGLDGSGKGTQTALLCDRIAQNGYRMRQISFPNYEDSSAALVKSYLAGEFGSSPDAVNAYAASSFYAVDRYAAYKKYWSGDYSDGVNIIADRYSTSNAVYQMTKLAEDKWDEYLNWLENYEYNLLELPRPNEVIYLDMPPEVSQRLMSERYAGDESKKDIHEENLAFQAACRRSALYAADKLGWHIVNCSTDGRPRSIESIADEVWGLVSSHLI